MQQVSFVFHFLKKKHFNMITKNLVIEKRLKIILHSKKCTVRLVFRGVIAKTLKAIFGAVRVR